MPETDAPFLWIARHGQSAGNVAADQAEATGLETIAIAERDADVALSPLGEIQARALGRWFAAQPRESQPAQLLISPYLRARATAAIVSETLAHRPSVIVDERLRERDLGAFDRLTRLGWQQRHPEQAELRARLGKFYHRPPGGESWCDVVLRVRALLSDLRAWGDRSTLVVTHQVVVLCVRYVLEHMDEAQLLRLDAAGRVANCALTSYARNRDPDAAEEFTLLAFNDTKPIEGDAPVTAAPDAPVAAR
jgi:broad specificity phosphatase PhoE